ncbi:MAG TPA: NosD domain-containing protein [Thermoanaerobaculia bacterium]|nr:NosD domain-containing protein [Thermoanaerobaculia bacterium]
MRRFVFPALLVLLVASLSAAPRGRPAARPPILIVDASFSAATPGWGTSSFAAIGDAIAAALPGSYLWIAAGTYRERLVVTKPLHLVGAGAGATIVEGEGGIPLTFRQTSAGSVSRLTLQGAPADASAAGLVVRSSTDIVAQDVVIRENARGGVYVESSQRIAISGATITGNGSEEGVQLRRCHDCAIEKSVVSHPNPLTLRGSMRARIEDNTLEAKAPGAAAAIFLHLGSNNAVIRGNVMTGADEQSNPCTMIRVMRSNGTLIEGNTITRGRIGIWIALSDGTVMAGNSIRDYGDGDGVTLFLSNDSTIVNNTIASTVRHPYGGVIVLNSHRNVVAGNRVSQGSRGISLHHGSTLNRIAGNDVSDVRYALVADGAPGNTFAGNNASGSVLGGYDNAANVWSEGGRGNWWGDYAGSDANGDGVGDAPHRLSGGGRDDAPLIARVSVADAPVPAAAVFPPLTESFSGASIADARVWQNEARSYTSVQVEAGGSLVMERVNLTIGASVNADLGECGLRVRSGGTLRVTDSTIDGNGFYICVERGGVAEVRGTEIRKAGIWHSAFNSRGDDSIFENNVVVESIHGAQFNPDTKGGRIVGNRFVNVNGGIGIWGANAEVRDNEIINPIASGMNVFTFGGGNRITGNDVTNAWHQTIELNEQSPLGPQIIHGNSFTGPAERPRIVSSYPTQWDDGSGRGNHWGNAYLDEIPWAAPHATLPGVWDTPYLLSASSGADRYPLICRAKATGTPPAAPVLRAPVNGATGTSSDLTLEWDAIDGVTTYRVVVAKDAAFRGVIVLNRGDVSQTQYVVRGLAKDTTYYWRALGKTGDCDGRWSPTASFRTAP